MHILAIVAGTNEQSNALTLAQAFVDAALEEGHTTHLIRLRDADLPHFTLLHYDIDTPMEPELVRLQESIARADGVLIASPIWNFSIPAHLKNLIDHMGRFALDRETRSKGQLEGKLFCFLFTGGAPLSAWRALQRFTTLHLPEAIRYFGGIPTGTFYEPKCMRGRGKFGLVVHERPESLRRAAAFGRRFCRIARRYKERRSLPLFIRMRHGGFAIGRRIISRLLR